MEDKCKGCVRINPMMKYKIEICPVCDQEKYVCYLEGNTYIKECTNCGAGLVSFSYFGNCESEMELCEYRLDFSSVDKEGLLIFCKRCNVKIGALLNAIRMGKIIRLRCELSEVINVEEVFERIKLRYVMDPPMAYSNFYTCKEAVRPKWLNGYIEVMLD